MGFLGGPVAKNLAVNAGDTSLIPGPEDATYHRATKPVLCNKKSHCNEKPMQRESSPQSLPLGKAHAAMKTQCRQKQNKKQNKTIFPGSLVAGDQDTSASLGRISGKVSKVALSCYAPSALMLSSLPSAKLRCRSIARL